MSPNLLLFTGAPPPSSVTDSTCTLTSYLPPFTSFLDIPSPSPPSSPTKFQVAAWRSLPLIRRPLSNGFTQEQQSYLSQSHHPSFYSMVDDASRGGGGGTASTADDEEDEAASQEAFTQFVEASLSALEDPSLLDSFETSFLSTSSAADARSQRRSQRQTVAPLPPPHLSDLEDVPSPKQILSLHPSTVTLNLIVTLLSVSQPRTILTRFGHSISLVELLVADDTRSGFTITFWIPPSQLGSHHVASLRRQEVVLFQNVALHVFRGKVYGQSLSKGLTKMTVLWSPDGHGVYSTRALSKAKASSSEPQLEKTRLVRDWGLKFVGAAPGTRTRSKRKLRSWDEPPPDSQ